jgi:hypothetical protein
MALPILDGNQSATTLSSILTSGEHIPAHTVVSLGTQAITDISGAVSGSVVSISNFPATQPVSIASVTIGNTVTIAGTVTANPTGTQTIAGTVKVDGAFLASGVTVFPSLLLWNDNALDQYEEVSSVKPLPIAGTVTIGSALPAGTNRIGVVTIGNIQRSGDGVQSSLLTEAGSGFLLTRSYIAEGTAQIGSVTASISNSVTIGSLPTISGTVTANGGDFSAIVGESMPAKAVAIGFYSGDDAGIAQVNDSNRKMPISGTVTVGNSVTIASFATSVTARLINPAGTAVTYAEVGTAGSPSIDVLSVQGVTSGTAIPISISSVTIGSLPAISGTVTANTFALQGTAVTTSDFTSTTDSTVLANYNASREVLTIFNEGAGNLHICAGATCTTIAYQVRLSAGDYYEVPNHQTTITHSAVFATAGTARVTEVS